MYVLIHIIIAYICDQCDEKRHNKSKFVLVLPVGLIIISTLFTYLLTELSSETLSLSTSESDRQQSTVKMSTMPMSNKPWPSLVSTLWFSFDSAEEDKELWLLEQEVAAELERVETKYCETTPLGKSGNEVDGHSYVDEDEEEEEDDNDDEESESNDDDDDEEVDMEVEDHESPPTY